MTQLTRRDVLKFAVNTLLGAGAALALGGLMRFLGYKSAPPPPREFDLGPVENFPPGSATVLYFVPAIVRHDDEGFSAISMKCTHLGCTVEHTNDAFECPCHGSRFDKDGKRTRGPAAYDLSTLRVETNESGNLILYLG